MSKKYTFKRKQIVNANAEVVFEFFSNPYNLRQVTPPKHRLEILNSYPIIMHKGLKLRFKFKPALIPMFWESEIIQWNPKQKSFMEQQVRGPFKTWVHKHIINGLNSEITEITDDITYTLPGGPLSDLLNNLIVKRQIQQMFDYRFQRLTEWFRPLTVNPFQPGSREPRKNNSRGQQRRRPPTQRNKNNNFK